MIWRRRERMARVEHGRVSCPFTLQDQDVERCFACDRLEEVVASADGSAPAVIRCRVEPWLDVPSALAT